MKAARMVIALCGLIAALGLLTAGTGLLLDGGDGAKPFTSLYGEHVTLYGRGLYHLDTLLTGPGFRGQDAVMLVVGLPLLLAALQRYRAGSPSGALLLAGTLMYVLYAYASMAFGATFNPLFPAYVLLFSASLFALVALLASIDSLRLTEAFAHCGPDQATATYLTVVGGVLLAVWGGLSLLPAALRGVAPLELAHSTTLVTHVLDLGVIVPAALLTAGLLRRRAPLGRVLAAPLLIMSALIGLTVAVATAAQVLAGYPYSAGQVGTLVLPFLFLALAGLRLAFLWFRALRAAQPPRAPGPTDTPSLRRTHQPGSAPPAPFVRRGD